MFVTVGGSTAFIIIDSFQLDEHNLKPNVSFFKYEILVDYALGQNLIFPDSSLWKIIVIIWKNNFKIMYILKFQNVLFYSLTNYVLRNFK